MRGVAPGLGCHFHIASDQVLEKAGDSSETPGFGRSDQIEFPRAALFGTAAVGTGAVNFQPVRLAEERVF